jgi:hypothetical protein
MQFATFKKRKLPILYYIHFDHSDLERIKAANSSNSSSMIDVNPGECKEQFSAVINRFTGAGWNRIQETLKADCEMVEKKSGLCNWLHLCHSKSNNYNLH